jgi:hypothetical protein
MTWARRNVAWIRVAPADASTAAYALGTVTAVAPTSAQRTTTSSATGGGIANGVSPAVGPSVAISSSCVTAALPVGQSAAASDREPSPVARDRREPGQLGRGEGEAVADRAGRQRGGERRDAAEPADRVDEVDRRVVGEEARVGHARDRADAAEVDVARGRRQRLGDEARVGVRDRVGADPPDDREPPVVGRRGGAGDLEVAIVAVRGGVRDVGVSQHRRAGERADAGADGAAGALGRELGAAVTAGREAAARHERRAAGGRADQ